MHIALAEQSVRLHMQERQSEAARHNRAARVAAVRRWERRAATASRRARAARSALG